MVTLNTIAYNILKNYRIQAKVSDDLDIRYVYQWVNNARAKYVKQRLDKSTFEIDQSLVQSLGAVELELVDSSIAMSLPTPLPADKFVRIIDKIIIATVVMLSGISNILHNFICYINLPINRRILIAVEKLA